MTFYEEGQVLGNITDSLQETESTSSNLALKLEHSPVENYSEVSGKLLVFGRISLLYLEPVIIIIMISMCVASKCGFKSEKSKKSDKNR